MVSKAELNDIWMEMRRIHLPSSWKEDATKILPLALIDTYVAGCYHTYIKMNPIESLDKQRVEILVACRRRLAESEEVLVDDEGKRYLELMLALCNMMLANNEECSNSTNNYLSPIG